MEYGHRYGGTSFELFAEISEKNHSHSTLNPMAAYQKKMSLDEIMNDVMIAYPNTRPMRPANCYGAGRRPAGGPGVEAQRRSRWSSRSRAVEDHGVDPDHRPVGRGVPDPAQT